MDTATIAAVSTPFGTGGIGVIRISGPEALNIAGRVFIAHSGKTLFEMKGFTSLLGKIFDGGDSVDEAICHVFRAPKSYTGEDVAEISCHGGIWILQKTLRLCFENGAQPAQPGEFTRRAFLNGKIDLTQAEAVMDLINAKGQSIIKAAILARDGEISKKTDEIAEILIRQSAHLAAWADFPEEDLEKLDIILLAETILEAIRKIDILLATYDRGRILREGIRAVIIGKPNVGKSTLMNLLTGEDSSIVTDIPGTTRDVIEDTIRLGDFVLRIADTAGIRDTDDEIELAGVKRSFSKIETAELILAVFDGADKLDDKDLFLLEHLQDKPCIAVINKNDLIKELDVTLIQEKFKYVVNISAKSGFGRGELEKAIISLLDISVIDDAAGILVNERQRLCLQAARDSLIQAQDALESGNMLDAVNVCIDFALDELLSLTGEKVSERVVDEVFSRFCVGK